jgi:hypothetical protein
MGAPAMRLFLYRVALYGAAVILLAGVGRAR